MRTVEKLIPWAIEAVSESKMEDEKKKGVVNKAYKGYISSLGAGIIQSGLLPSLAMYKGNEDSDKKKANPGRLLKAIFYVIKEQHKPDEIQGDDLFKYALDAEDQERVKKEILDASIAIKLAIRTFKLEDL
jgi:CRISPR-associated protein Cmr5